MSFDKLLCLSNLNAVMHIWVSVIYSVFVVQSDVLDFSSFKGIVGISWNYQTN